MDLTATRIKARTILERAVLELEELKVGLVSELRSRRGRAKFSKRAEDIRDQINVFEKAIGVTKTARSAILLELTCHDNAPAPELNPALDHKVFQLSSLFHFRR